MFICPFCHFLVKRANGDGVVAKGGTNLGFYNVLKSLIRKPTMWVGFIAAVTQQDRPTKMWLCKEPIVKLILFIFQITYYHNQAIDIYSILSYKQELFIEVETKYFLFYFRSDHNWRKIVYTVKTFFKKLPKMRLLKR